MPEQMMQIRLVSSKNFQKAPNILQHEAENCITLSSVIKCLSHCRLCNTVCEFIRIILSETTAIATFTQSQVLVSKLCTCGS